MQWPSLYNQISELGLPLRFPVDIFRRWCKLGFGPWQETGKLKDKTYKKQVFCLIFLPTSTSKTRKKIILLDAEITVFKKLIFLP